MDTPNFVINIPNKYDFTFRWLDRKRIPSGLTILQIADTQITGDFTNTTFSPTITSYNFPAGAIGDLSGKQFNMGTTQFYAPAASFTKMMRGNYKDFNSSVGLYLVGNDLNSAEIDDLLININNYYSTVTPIKNQLYNLSGTGMGIPSASGLTARQGIIDKFTAAGFTATITVNS